jgi:hypothetical protein
MSVYKIFPIQDTTLYSKFNTTNAGLDEMNEVGVYNNPQTVFKTNLVLSELSADDIRRTLIQFSQDQILDVVKIASSSISTKDRINGTTSSVEFSSSLKMFAAFGDNLAMSYTIEAYPVSELWQNGLGKFVDAPTNKEGVGWLYRGAAFRTQAWNILSGSAAGRVTASYVSSSLPTASTHFVEGTLYTTASNIRQMFIRNANTTGSLWDQQRRVSFPTLSFADSYSYNNGTASIFTSSFSASSNAYTIGTFLPDNDATISSSYKPATVFYIGTNIGTYVQDATPTGSDWIDYASTFNTADSIRQTGSYFLTYGGGDWDETIRATQEYGFTSDKDINMDVNNIVNYWVAGAPNFGFILKMPTSIENNGGSFVGLKFYSMETHTIFPPCLEVKWDDSTFETSSNYPYLTTPSSSTAFTYSASFSSSISASVTVWATQSFTSSFVTNYSQSVVNPNTFEVVSSNNLSTYKNNSVYNFRFRGRDQYPQRRFTTSSIYLDWKYLPKDTYWGLQDYRTSEMVVDFDPYSTKLSIDPSGSFCKIYMNGLEPERSYKILLKSEFENGETVITDRDLIFKVVN